MDPIEYRYSNDLDLEAVVQLYRASTLGTRRPVDDPERMAAMLTHANLIVTAWQREELIGIARTLTDFTYVGYLADLAVHAAYQRQGIGVELIARTRAKMGPQSRLLLVAAPAAVDYYPKIGFTPLENAWSLRATEAFPSHRPA